MVSKNKIVLFNSGETQVVYDEEGRVLGAVERVTLDELDSVGEAAVAAGLLVREEPGESKGEAKSATAGRGSASSAKSSDSGSGGSGVSTRAKAD